MSYQTRFAALAPLTVVMSQSIKQNYDKNRIRDPKAALEENLVK
jgi:hypothetical protein